LSGCVADCFFYFYIYFYQILTTLNNLKIMSKVTHGKWLKLQSNSDVSNTMDRSNCFLVPVNFAVNSFSHKPRFREHQFFEQKVELFYYPVKIFFCIYMFYIIVYLIEETTALNISSQRPETTVSDPNLRSVIVGSSHISYEVKTFFVFIESYRRDHERQQTHVP